MKTYNFVHPDTMPLPYEVGEKHDMNPEGPCSCLQHRAEACIECFPFYKDEWIVLALYDNTMAPHDKTWMLDGPRTTSPSSIVTSETNVISVVDVDEFNRVAREVVFKLYPSQYSYLGTIIERVIQAVFNTLEKQSEQGE